MLEFPLNTFRLLGVAVLLGTLGCAHARVAARGEGWRRIETEHITLRTDMRRRDAVQAARAMQRTRDAFAKHSLACAFERPSRIDVTIVSRRSDFELVGQRWSSGYFQGSDSRVDDAPRRIVLPGWKRVSVQVFQHELTHRLARACWPAMPPWLDEGMASYFETAIVEDDATTVGVPTYLFARREEIVQIHHRGVIALDVPDHFFMPPSMVTALGPQEFYLFDSQSRTAWRDRQSAYASAWALVHYLQHAPDDVFAAYGRFLYALLAPSTDGAATFARELGRLDLDARVRRHIETDRREILVFRNELPQAREPQELPMTSAEGHLEWARLFWNLSNPARQAHALEHLALAMEDPRVRPTARAMIARSHAANGGRDAVVAELERALAEDGEEPRLLEIWLELELERAPRTDETRARTRAVADRLATVAQSAYSHVLLSSVALESQDSERALTHAARAVAIDADCFRCHLAHANALRSRGQPWAAVDAIERAVRVVPHDDTYVLEQLRAILRRFRDDAQALEPRRSLQ